MSLDQPAAQLIQRHVRPPLDLGANRFVMRRQLQRLLVALNSYPTQQAAWAPGPGRRITRHPLSLQRLVNERNADTKPLGRSVRRQAAIESGQHPFPQIRRVALPRTPRHHPSSVHHNREV